MPYKDPEIEKAYRKRWRARPEVKKRLQANQARYMSKPEAKAARARRKKQYDLSNQSKHRSRHLERTYGLSLDEWSALLAKQKGVCAICGESSSRFVVDHDHVTGVVRGILCHGCNLKLPILENALLLTKALAYLKTHQTMAAHAPPDLK